MRALIIRKPHIDNILDGLKVWEMRAKPLRLRETIGLIEAGSGCVTGVADVVDCLGPLSLSERIAAEAKHRVPAHRWNDPETAKYVYAWVFADARRLANPVPYRHPRGAQGFVTLDDDVAALLGTRIGSGTSMPKSGTAPFAHQQESRPHAPQRALVLLEGQHMTLNINDNRVVRARRQFVVRFRWYPKGEKSKSPPPPRTTIEYIAPHLPLEVAMTEPYGDTGLRIDPTRIGRDVRLLNRTGVRGKIAVEMDVEVEE